MVDRLLCARPPVFSNRKNSLRLAGFEPATITIMAFALQSSALSTELKPIVIAVVLKIIFKAIYSKLDHNQLTHLFNFWDLKGRKICSHKKLVRQATIAG